MRRRRRRRQRQRQRAIDDWHLGVGVWHLAFGSGQLALGNVQTGGPLKSSPHSIRGLEAARTPLCDATLRGFHSNLTPTSLNSGHEVHHVNVNIRKPAGNICLSLAHSPHAPSEQLWAGKSLFSGPFVLTHLRTQKPREAQALRRTIQGRYQQTRQFLEQRLWNSDSN